MGGDIPFQKNLSQYQYCFSPFALALNFVLLLTVSVCYLHNIQL